MRPGRFANGRDGAASAGGERVDRSKSRVAGDRSAAYMAEFFERDER